MIAKERMYFFDNVKAFLIILVVFGHLLEYFINVNDFFKWAYIVIYSFHMPLFIFVSGFLSKNNDFKKTAPSILFQFFSFNVLYAVFILIMFLINPAIMEASLNRISLERTVDIFITLLTPYWLMWYMLSLLFWRILLLTFKKSPMLLILAIVIGLLFGFVNIYGRILSIQRTLAFFPFFLAGYFSDYEMIQKLTRTSIKKVLLMIAIFISAMSYYYIDMIDVNIFYQSDSFRHLGLYGFDGIITRTILYIVSLFMSAVFLMFVPHRRIILTDMGLKTFNIYILHGFIIQFLWTFRFFTMLEPMHTISIFFILAALNWLIICLLSSNYVTILMKKISLKNILEIIKKGKG